MPASVLSFSSLPSRVWGANAGRTKDIASGPAQPPGVPGWRLSAATIEKSGPFSRFEGMDRITVPVEGELLVLEVNGVEHAMERFRPFRYPGDAPATASLPTGEVTVLNAFVDRARFGASAMVVELSKKNAPSLGPDQFLVLLHGSARAVGGDGTSQALDPLDTVPGSEDRPQVLGRGYAAVISFYALD